VRLIVGEAEMALGRFGRHRGRKERQKSGEYGSGAHRSPFGFAPTRRSILRLPAATSSDFRGRGKSNTISGERAVRRNPAA